MPACKFCDYLNPANADRCQGCGASLFMPGSDTKSATESVHNRVLSLVQEGRKIDAIKLYREETGAGLAEAKEAVERVAIQPANPVSGKDERILSLLRKGEKIAAIKLHRERTGAGLKEAKDTVEALAAQHGIHLPARGCAGAACLMIACAIALWFLMR